MQQAKKFLCVAVCTRNRASLLGETVRSVLPQLVDNTKLLIVDNASTDNTCQLAAGFVSENDSVEVLREPELGLSHARNLALRSSAAEWVLFLDDDAIAHPNLIRGYLAFLINAPPVVAVAGGQVIPRFEKALPPWLDPRINALDCGAEPFAFAKGGPWGCNIAYHRESALNCGGFNPSLGRKGKFQGAHEESFLNEQLRRKGHEVWWVPGVPVDHFVEANRLELPMLCRLAFDGGRSSALVKMAFLGLGARRRLAAMSTLILPARLALHLLAGLTLFLTWKRAAAARQLFSALRALGFVRQVAGQVDRV